MLLRDKLLGRYLSEFMDQERDAELAAMDPRNPLSPDTISSGGGIELEENPFDSELNECNKGEDDRLDFSTPQNESENNFVVLSLSLPDQLPEQHHLASYITA
ncbi:uncharacterized protein PHACADRAFT_248762 [Phanerochaete carnosa HHB-10118-sp]|uniref:Uncharacterized protein n=1 Tax=Phanerochaete carnosa (strain HHB-10118-sp) TaxID=650164 RepID=K5WD55_PHACS|nr:uncharacterized protein PHACADRAFT_248762 [Phanerochaete carnosa HHB-10118-sp]EKM61868.1 hypothetical protein PHACADRAFT_248762 [Phanerochaete carnosa HHB-10118-sp]